LRRAKGYHSAIAPVNAPGHNNYRNSAMDAPETITVAATTLACDGGGGALGHPRVFLNLGAEATIDCPYCGRRYVLAESVETEPTGEG
jgi:uncharacterized Zn-finger protein